MRIRKGGLSGLVVMLAIVLVAAGCGSSASKAAKGPRLKGGTATVALLPGNSINWILPMCPAQYATGPNLEDFEYLMWRPLYWIGSPTGVGLNTVESLAEPATITTSGGDTVAAITLKHYRWSDGKPVTTRDVQFWFNLLRANKDNWWGYTTGQFPDNVLSFKADSAYQLTITFKGIYGSLWLYNELSQLIPMPQHAWDKTSASGPVGNYDDTPRGATAVYNYLAAQSKDLASYATNPLWQVVDGPWKVKVFVASVGQATLARNFSYSGPATGSIHQLDLTPYTSDSAEFDTLLTGSGLSYGYVPFNDTPQLGRVKSLGYEVKAWPSWGITFINLNFVDPQYGPLFKQLYFRQALQELVDQPRYISAFMGGYASPVYGPVPTVPNSQFVSPQEKSNPYPYSPAGAKTLLSGHGWSIVPNGADVCTRPGSGPTECGSGVKQGMKLDISLLYNSGLTNITEEIEALRSAASQVGIDFSLSEAPFSQVVSTAVSCTKPNCWQMDYYGQGWYWNPGYEVPDGSVIFGTGSPSNGGSYSSPTADSLMKAVHSGSLAAIYAYENYLAKQLPVIWMPQIDTQISAVSDHLGGALPQDPLNNIYPENWYLTR